MTAVLSGARSGPGESVVWETLSPKLLQQTALCEVKAVLPHGDRFRLMMLSALSNMKHCMASLRHLSLSKHLNGVVFVLAARVLCQVLCVLQPAQRWGWSTRLV